MVLVKRSLVGDGRSLLGDALAFLIAREQRRILRS